VRTNPDRTRPGRLYLAVMILGLLAMFAWSFVYRAKNPALTAPLDQPSQTASGMAMPEGMNEIMEAMGRLKKEPDSVEAMVGAAEAFMNIKMWPKATMLLDKAAAKAPDNPDVFMHMGVALYNQDRLPEAVTAFERVVAIDPQNFLAQYDLGTIYLHGLNDPAKAKPYFQAVVDNPASDEKTKDQARQALGGS